MSNLLAGLQSITRPRVSHPMSSKYAVPPRDPGAATRAPINWIRLRREALANSSNRPPIVSPIPGNFSAGSFCSRLGVAKQPLDFERNSSPCSRAKRSRVDLSNTALQEAKEEESSFIALGKKTPTGSTFIDKSTRATSPIKEKCRNLSVAAAADDGTISPASPINQDAASTACKLNKDTSLNECYEDLAKSTDEDSEEDYETTATSILEIKEVLASSEDKETNVYSSSNNDDCDHIGSLQDHSNEESLKYLSLRSKRSEKSDIGTRPCDIGKERSESSAYAKEKLDIPHAGAVVVSR